MPERRLVRWWLELIRSVTNSAANAVIRVNLCLLSGPAKLATSSVRRPMGERVPTLPRRSRRPGPGI